MSEDQFVSIHDIEPSPRIVLVTLLFSHKTEGLLFFVYIHSVLGHILEGIEEVLGSFHPVHASTWYQSRVSRRDTSKRSREDQVKEGNIRAGKK